MSLALLFHNLLLNLFRMLKHVAVHTLITRQEIEQRENNLMSRAFYFII